MTKRGAIRQIADLLEIDPKSVRNALSSAGIPSDLGGRSIEETAEIVRAIVDPARVIGHAATRATGGGRNALSDVRAEHERLKIRELEIEIARSEGRLVERASVIESLALVTGAARVAFMGLGVRCAPKLVGIDDPKEIVRIIESEARHILEGLADDMKFFDKMVEDVLS